MIIEQATDFLYLSDKLESKYPIFYKNLVQILNENKIDFGILKNTKDIWCRDYMPIQVGKNDYVNFKYNPDYLEGLEDLKTDAQVISENIGLKITHSDINLDGGNVVNTVDKAILTDKIFKENPKYTQEDLLWKLKTHFGLLNIIIIPHLPYDEFGHADGMVRFYTENTVIVNDFSSTQSESWQKKFRESLELHNLDILELPYLQFDEQNEEGVYSAKGCYINYLHVGNHIIVPTFDLPQDKKAIEVLRKLYHETEVHPLNSLDIARDGGVLNCISWNICKHRIPMIQSLKEKIDELQDYGNAVINTVDKLERIEKEIFEATMDIATKGEWIDWERTREPGKKVFIDYEDLINCDDENVAELGNLLFKIHKARGKILTGYNNE